MSSLPIHAEPMSVPLPGFGRVIAFVSTLLDVFNEAQARARIAHQQYPFADW
ncbi:hypothetical protein [Pseudolabrys taiwanensis]|uniref:hypothetical protein n=1 Tax=Pseudolabrys taiwanensis TaxID=331696 RepID=UPI0013B45C6A|nr:hypothetical protein [Pseudolabrys taiwanensis]